MTCITFAGPRHKSGKGIVSHSPLFAHNTSGIAVDVENSIMNSTVLEFPCWPEATGRVPKTQPRPAAGTLRQR